MPVPPLSEHAVALRYAQALPVLMKACGIDPLARTAFDARVRQLQRLGVLGRDEARPKGRIDYGIVELAALATAVRLMGAFMVPSLAARYATERWTTLVPALLAGARSALPKDYLARRPLGDGTMVVIEAGALAEVGRQGRHDERYVGALGMMIVVDRTTPLAALEKLGGGGLVLDTTTYMPVIVEGVARATMATETELWHELDRLRFSA